MTKTEELLGLTNPRDLPALTAGLAEEWTELAKYLPYAIDMADWALKLEAALRRAEQALYNPFEPDNQSKTYLAVKEALAAKPKEPECA